MRLFFLAAMLAMAASPSLAAEKLVLPGGEDVKGKQGSGTHDWSGFYAGAEVGAAMGTSRSKWDGDASSTSTGVFGAHAGYNYQFNRGLVIGAESDLNHRN